jgi:hypothetical protein
MSSTKRTRRTACSDTGSPYEAHMRRSDGSEVVVYVNKSFEVTSVASMQHP